jgi:catechol 2,3-dioxygenase-like lactoylglutathione lyase family enzyme
MDNVLIVVEDLEAAKAFFADLGMELEGETQVEGDWAGRVVGLEGVRADIAMMRTPDGHGKVELSRFHTPPAVRAEPEDTPANALGIRRIMFAVDDIDDLVARLRKNHGAELLDEIAQYKDLYRLCFLRGPEGIIVGLAEQLGWSQRHSSWRSISLPRSSCWMVALVTERVRVARLIRAWTSRCDFLVRRATSPTRRLRSPRRRSRVA